MHGMHRSTLVYIYIYHDIPFRKCPILTDDSSGHEHGDDGDADDDGVAAADDHVNANADGDGICGTEMCTGSSNNGCA